MEEHKLELSPAATHQQPVAAGAPVDALTGPSDAAATPEEAAVAPAAHDADTMLISSYPKTINALDFHEGRGLMAYTHLGCADDSITVRPLPPPVTAR